MLYEAGVFSIPLPASPFLSRRRALAVPIGRGQPPSFVYGSYEGDYEDGGDEHQAAGSDEAECDEDDGAGARLVPGTGGPDEGEERGEEGQEDQDHAAGEVPDLDGRLLDGVGQAPFRVAGTVHVLQDAPELRLTHEPDDPREVVRLPRRLARAKELQVVASIKFDRP